MRLVFHPAVFSDITSIMEYYEQVASPDLADQFYDELKYFFEQVAQRPESFAIRHRDIRRANLLRFPYHFLFRISDHHIRILVIRHHRRHPSKGKSRR